MMLLERELPLQGVKVLSLECFHQALHSYLLPGGEPRVIQEGAFLAQSS